MKLPSRKDIGMMAEAARTLRDRILIQFLYEAGCTPQEATLVRVRDINLRTSSVYISAHGRKPARLSYISVTLAREIATYVSRSKPTDYLFSITKTHPLTPKRIAQIVEELSTKSLGYKLTPLQIRYAHIKNALDFGIPLLEVQRQVGLYSARAIQLYNELRGGGGNA